MGLHTRLAPEAPGYPLVGILPRLWRDPIATFVNMERELGEVVHFRVARRHTYLISNPDLARTLLRSASDYKRTNRRISFIASVNTGQTPDTSTRRVLLLMNDPTAADQRTFRLAPAPTPASVNLTPLPWCASSSQ